MKYLLGLVSGAVLIVLSVMFSAPAASAQAGFDYTDLIAEQQASWGLADPGTSNAVGNFSSLSYALEEAGGHVIVGGNFLSVTNGPNKQTQPYAAAFDTRTGAWDPSFTPQVGGPVLSLLNAPDGNLFVAGEMKTWNNVNIGSFAKINPVNGDLISSFPTRVFGGTAAVRDMHLGVDGWLYLSGSFTTANDGGVPVAVNNIIRVNPNTGALDRSWIPNIPSFSGIWGVSRSHTNDTVYLAGWTNAGFDRNLSALGISATTTAVVWDDFVMNFGCCGHMYDVEATSFGTVFFVGEQHGAYMYDESNNMALMINHVTSYDSRYQASNVRRGGDYQDIELIGDTLFATCHCWGSHSSGTSLLNYNGDISVSGGTHTGSVNAVIAYDAQTGVRDQAFNPYMAGDIGGWATLAASDGCLWLAGGFNAVGNPGSQTPGRDLVRLCDANGGQGSLAAPASCTATIENGSVDVAWNSAAGASDYVVYRSVNGGNIFWRGVSSGTSFTDSDRDGTLTYYVASRASGELSTQTQCTTDVVVPPPASQPAPASCSWVVNGGTIQVDWAPAAGATKYVVYRSVNGSSQFWRGAVTNGTTFNDSNRTGQLVYFVEAVGANNLRSARTQCSEGQAPPPAGPQPVAFCSVALNNGIITVTWPQVADPASEYVISRSVDGGTRFWRGKVSSTSFTDSDRAGAIEYFVETKLGNQKSAPVPCTPVV